MVSVGGILLCSQLCHKNRAAHVLYFGELPGEAGHVGQPRRSTPFEGRHNSQPTGHASACCQKCTRSGFYRNLIIQNCCQLCRFQNAINGLTYCLKHCVDQMGFPAVSDSKASACDAGDLGLVPRSRRSSGEEKGYSLQYSHLENSADRG